MRKLTVYGNAWNVRSAGQWYRIRVPLMVMKKLDLAETFIDDPFMDSGDRERFIWTGAIQVHYLIGGKPIHKQIKSIQEFEPKRDELGMLQYPPTLIFDADDDIETTSPLNPKFAVLGTRDNDGNLLDPRSDIGIKMGPDEDPVYLWQHGVETAHGSFDAARNIINHASVRKVAATCHAMTVTSPDLAEVAKKWNPKVYVYPNSLLFDEFQTFDIRRPADEVRVMWQGGYSHFPDFYPLRGAFHEAHQRMPQIKWVVFGTLFPWVYEQISQFRVEFHPWVAHELFHMKMGTLVPDINIAPLADNRFNRCKSAIKFYEAAALKVPTLASNVGPYKEIIDGETGLLFSSPAEFVEKLEHLVKDADYRRKLGNAAHDWVREHRDAMKTVPKLYEFYVSMAKEARGLNLAA